MLLLSFQTLGLCLLALILYFTLSVLWNKVRDEREVNALGGRAPIAPTKFPLGLDYLYGIIQAAKRNEMLWFMHKMMPGTSRGNYTSEVSLLGGRRSILTADPENIKAIVGAGQFDDFGKGSKWQEAFGEFLGNSIFTVDGKPWHDLRQLMRPIFNKERVADLGVFEKHIQKLLPHLGKGDGAEIDIRSLFVRFSMDVAIEYLLGTDLDSMNHPDGEYAKSWDDVQHVQALILRAGPLKFLIPRAKFRKGIVNIDDLMRPFVQQVLRMDPAELEEKLSHSDTFLHQLARYTKDEKTIRDQIVTVLLAGRDTTGATLSWIFYELARRPDVVSKLRKEIVEHVGSNPDALPTYANLKEMKYLSHVINETFRLYPTVPFNMRMSFKDTTIPRGGGPDGLSPVGVQKNSIIVFSTLMMQRRRDLYPPISKDFPYDPADWVPDRWETWTPKPWHFIPFSGGPRICIGQQFALLEVQYTVCRMLQYFKRLDSKVDVGTTVTDILHVDLVLTPATDMKVGLYKA